MSKQIEITELKQEFPTLNKFEGGIEIQLIGKDYDAQIEQIWQNRKNAEMRKQAEAEQAAAKSALLAKLGITADEAKLLLS